MNQPKASRGVTVESASRIASMSDLRVPSILVVPTPILPLPILNHRPSAAEVLARAAPTNGPDGRLVPSRGGAVGGAVAPLANNKPKIVP
jgi:hypothetical protein